MKTKTHKLKIESVVAYAKKQTVSKIRIALPIDPVFLAKYRAVKETQARKSLIQIIGGGK